MTEYVGYKKYCRATVMNEPRIILVQEDFPNSSEGYDSFLARTDGELKVALQASYFWELVYDEFEEIGFEVKVAHPRKTRIIADEKIKS